MPVKPGSGCLSKSTTSGRERTLPVCATNDRGQRASSPPTRKLTAAELPSRSVSGMA